MRTVVTAVVTRNWAALAWRIRVKSFRGPLGTVPGPKRSCPGLTDTYGVAGYAADCVRLADASVTCRWRKREILRGVSLDVPAGTLIGVVGQNGIRRSALLRIISGHLPPDAESVHQYGS
ncbi:ATP-binding cassette domain-containing protein [Actinacidiphila oryziradicis]|uniref:ATP-binding cassette domain-containing protein n=1 Tax=Actinacidiphila oryziradicis TaxID=2571141 RepID=A0A4U0SLJ6_9ACTN|nr:ATP-binding cassette domain-containing protein [Actinacidiphila oryziradicis]